jgi:hypothetical protein
MIETTDLIAGARYWYKEPYAVPGGDILLSAFVSLRLISADMLDLGSPNKQGYSSSRIDLLSKLLNSEINTWEKDWLSLFNHGSCLLVGSRLADLTTLSRKCSTHSTISCELLWFTSSTTS